MTEQKIGTWEGLVATAKTSTWIHNELYYTNSDPQEKWVSLGLVLQQREQLRKLLDGFGSIDDYDNDDVIELIKGLSEVLGSGKEGDEK